MRRNGGKYRKALQRNTASFDLLASAKSWPGVKKETSMLSQPPCISYKHLLCFEEFDEVAGKIEVCTSQDQLANTNAYYKQFKGAYADLLTMIKAATKRLKDQSTKAEKDLSERRTRARVQPKRRQPSLRCAMTRTRSMCGRALHPSAVRHNLAWSLRVRLRSLGAPGKLISRTSTGASRLSSA